MTESNHVSIQSVFGQVNLVVFQTRMISVMRETGSGEREREGLIKKEFQNYLQKRFRPKWVMME